MVIDINQKYDVKEAILKQILSILLVLSLAVSANAKVAAQPVEYNHNGTVLEGYLAYDDAVKGKQPGVLVIHEWWGLNDYVRNRVEKLAKLGYVAFALEMYGKGIWTKEPQKAKEWIHFR